MEIILYLIEFVAIIIFVLLFIFIFKSSNSVADEINKDPLLFDLFFYDDE